MNEKYDTHFRFRGGSICSEYYPKGFVSYSRGLRELIINTMADPAFVGNAEALIRHILFMSRSNHVEESSDGSFALFAVSFGPALQFKHCLRVEYTFRETDKELEYVALMLRSEAGE